MTNHERDAALNGLLQEILSVEAEIEGLIDRALPAVRAHTDAREELEELLIATRAHQASLRAEMDRRGVGGGKGQHFPPMALPSGDGSIVVMGEVLVRLRNVYMAVCRAAISYVALSTAAFRLYDPPLRKLGPAHLRPHLAAARAFERLIPVVTARELLQRGLECQCICPMCSLGACGCVAVGLDVLEETMAEVVPQRQAGPGFPLQKPRSGSQLQATGVEEGDSVLAVDGTPVRVYGEIQAAIRRHLLGNDVRLTVHTAKAGERTITVKHVSDYPR